MVSLPYEPGRTLPAKSLDFWFDYTCPYAYLGSTQAEAVARRMGVALSYRPMLLGGVFKARSTPQDLASTMGQAKAAHQAHDLARWAKRFGVPLRMPETHPMRSVEALRATLATGVDPRVVHGFYRAYWVENRNIAAPEVVRDVVSAAGHDATAVLARATSDEIKKELFARTAEAIALGIFGAPTWIVDGQYFYWGQDRLHFVEGLTMDSRPAPQPVTGGDRARTLEVYWDFSSPFAYLGVSQLPRIAREHHVNIVERPILLGGLFRSLGGTDVPLFTFSPEKQRWVGRDVDQWAAYWGVPFRFPSRFPTNSLRALRIWYALPEDRREAFRDSAFRATWVEDRDLTADDVLASLVGADAADVFARAGSDPVKNELRAATDAALARGVFGVPTWVVGGSELYWGQDRLDLVTL